MSEPLEVKRTSLHFTFNPMDEWPPVLGEYVWATHLDGHRYLIDNIPFFATGVSLNDVVEAIMQDDGDEPEFARKLNAGGHSTLRILVEDMDENLLIGQLKDLGCGLERGFGMFAVDIPPDSPLDEVLALCERLLASEAIGYETACLQR